MLNFALIDRLDHTKLERNASLAAALPSHHRKPRTLRSGSLLVAICGPQPYFATPFTVAPALGGGH
jgi:hypothetical protein